MTPTPPVTPEALSDLIVRGDADGVARALSDSPALVAARSADGDQPLHVACWQKQLEIVGQLVSFGPDLDARGCYGRTPLHYAVHEGRMISVPIVSLLMSLGADPGLKDDQGFTPADWARVEMHEGLAEVLALLGGGRPGLPGRPD